MVLQSGRNTGKGARERKGTTSRAVVVSFDQMAAPVPEIIDGSLFNCYNNNDNNNNNNTEH
jgi:hypothetical protein